MTAMSYEEIREEVLKLPASERLRLFAEVIQQDTILTDTEPLSDEEIALLMSEVGSEPLTGAEIVAQGLLGGWEDLDIADSVEWLNQQKQKRRMRNQW